MNYTIEPWDTKVLDQEFLATVEEMLALDIDLIGAQSIQGFAPHERYYLLWSALKQAKDLPGNFVQCGVYKGEQAYFMAKETDRIVHLFDSFEGATEFDEFDNDFYKAMPFKCAVEDCEKTLAGFTNVSINVGRVPANFDKVGPISLLHIDLDLHLPTKISLENLWSKIVDNGIVMVDTHDDVATGVTKAITEFAESVGRELQVLPAGVIVITK
jgi:O-methyltransferase